MATRLASHPLPFPLPPQLPCFVGIHRDVKIAECDGPGSQGWSYIRFPIAEHYQPLGLRSATEGLVEAFVQLLDALVKVLFFSAAEK